MPLAAYPRRTDTGRLARAVPPAYLFMSALGVVGLVGLLVASRYAPPFAAPLRIMAITWFLGFGVLRMVLGRKP